MAGDYVVDGVKLGLNLGEPDLGISGAEGWQLDANCCDSYWGCWSCLSGCGSRLIDNLNSDFSCDGHRGDCESSESPMQCFTNVATWCNY